MSDEQSKPSRWGLYIKKFIPEKKKDRESTAEEQWVESVVSQLFIDKQIAALQGFAIQLEAKGFDEEKIQAQLGFVISDVITSRFGGAMGERNPITPKEQLMKSLLFEHFWKLVDHPAFGVQHPRTLKNMRRCMIVLASHASRSVTKADLQVRVNVPWSIAPPNQNKFGSQQGRPKKDSLET